MSLTFWQRMDLSIFWKLVDEKTGQSFCGECHYSCKKKAVNPAELKRILVKCAQFVFKSGLGQLKGIITAQLKTKPECQSKFYKPRPVPYALKAKVEETIERMVAERNLEKLDYCARGRAIPIVPVTKNQMEQQESVEITR